MTRAVNRIVTQGKNPKESEAAPRMVLSSTAKNRANEYPNLRPDLGGAPASKFEQNKELNECQNEKRNLSGQFVPETSHSGSRDVFKQIHFVLTHGKCLVCASHCLKLRFHLKNTCANCPAARRQVRCLPAPERERECLPAHPRSPEARNASPA